MQIPVSPVIPGITEIPSLGLRIHLSKEELQGMAQQSHPALMLIILGPVSRACPSNNTMNPYLRKDSIKITS